MEVWYGNLDVIVNSDLVVVEFFDEDLENGFDGNFVDENSF